MRLSLGSSSSATITRPLYQTISASIRPSSRDAVVVPSCGRSISSLVDRFAIASPEIRNEFHHAFDLVRKYDPANTIHGLLIKSNEAKLGYFAIRAFWVASGLRFRQVSSTSVSRSSHITGTKPIEMTPEERIEYWKEGIESLYEHDISYHYTQEEEPILRILSYIMHNHNPLSREYFDRIILEREADVGRKQFQDMQTLVNHADMSCGSLMHLVLESAGILKHDDTIPDEKERCLIRETAKDIGITHGLTNALRLSVPTLSNTGLVVIPQDLCEKYGVKSPRYLLSALGMGDEECKQHLQDAIRDIVFLARCHLESARHKRDEILDTTPDVDVATKVFSAFLPVVSSEVFLHRLEKHQYDLTDRNLRNVGFGEHLNCIVTTLDHWRNKKY